MIKAKADITGQSKEYIEREKWFYDRIGKLIFRNKTACECAICTAVWERGLIILDARHAGYLFDIEGMYNHEGVALKYFDTKEEAELFEKQDVTH